MLYYGRYVRNEAFVALFGIVSLWAVIRYLESEHLLICFADCATSLHFATKETSYIYHAALLIFLAFYLIYRLASKHWQISSYRNYFLFSLILALLLVGGWFYDDAPQWCRGSQRHRDGCPAIPGQEAVTPLAAPISLFNLSTRSLPLFYLAWHSVSGRAIFFVIKGYTITSSARNVPSTC